MFRLVAGNLAGMSDEGQRAWQLSREELEARITEQDAVIAALWREKQKFPK